MTDSIEVFVDHNGQTRVVGRYRYIARQPGQSLVFEYADVRHSRADAFALDANLLEGL